MNYREVDRSRWAEFCREFSFQHESWLVTLRQEVRGPEESGTEQPLAVNQQFWGITAEEHEGSHRITISMGAEDGHFAHVINEPHRLLVEQTESGEDHGLRVEAADGVTTMEFRVPAFPEALDEVSALDI